MAGIRNRLFTSITRSKSWVRVVGIGDSMDELCREFEELRCRNFKLCFKYPTDEQLEQLRIVYRDMTPEEKSRVRRANRSMDDLLQDLKILDKGELDKQMVKKLVAELSG